MKKGADKNSIDGELLRKLYSQELKSSAQIAKILGCSEHKVNYWLEKHVISKRTISEAVYARANPDGDPFSFVPPKNMKEAKLFGMGLGLYWGEGNKANKNTVKLGNSDTELMEAFIVFMEKFFKVERKLLKFHLHLFTDIDADEAFSYWMKKLKISRKQFYKPTITRTGKLGTYRKKSKYGVLSLYFSNTKLRNIIVGLLKKPE